MATSEPQSETTLPNPEQEVENDDKQETEQNPLPATIHRNDDGKFLAANIVVTPLQSKLLNIPPDAKKLLLTVRDGEPVIEPVFE